MAGADILERIPTHERRLDNGLTVLVREERSAPVVAIVTHVKAGYFNEPDGVVGISHVLEHMYFKGTERFGAGEIARATKAVGGYLNAGTIYDYTSYYTVLPSSSLEHGLEIQADALCNSQIDPEELRRELEVIIQESRRKLDNPHAVARESLYEGMFDVHRMRRWRIGTEEELRRLTREDVWNYYRNLYRAPNIVVVVAGDVEPERAFELIERHYRGVTAGAPVKEYSPEEPARREPRFREMSGDIVQTHLEWGWRTPGTLHADTPALDLLAVILGQGRASRLYRGVREGGWVTGIGAANYTPTELGVFTVSAELRPADTGAAVAAIWREIEALGRNGPDSEEIERAHNIAEARLLRNLETVEGQANLLAHWQALGDWRLLGEYERRLLETTTEDVRRVARAYLGLEDSTLLIYRPDDADRLGWDTSEVARVVANPPPGPLPAPAPAIGGAAARTGAAVQDGVEDGVHFYRLANGTRIVVKPRDGSPLVSLGLFLTGGASNESGERAGATGLMARVSLKGTRERSARRIAEEVEALGGVIAPSVGPDMFHWSIALPARHAARAASLLVDVALRPTFPADELDRERKIALSDLEELRDDMYRYPMRLFLQAAFEGDPYGFSVAATEAALTSLDREALEAWHRERVLDVQPWVIAVGGVDPDATAEMIAAELGAATGREVADAGPEPRWAEGPREEAERRTKAQTALVLGFPGPRRDDEDAYAFEVLSNAISGLGGRLFEELRSRRSLAYTVAAYPLVRRRAGAFLAYIATSPEREDEARTRLIEQFERLAEETIGQDELARSQAYTIGAWKIRTQTNGAQLADLATALLLGRGLAELRAYEDRIRAVTPVRIRDAFQRYYDPDRIVEGIVRGTGGGR